jgi:hypothetical protein
LLLVWDANEVEIRAYPGSLVRRPERCRLLEVAVGAGSIEVTKCLLEFHGARPTRETLKMALSSGNIELIRLMWERLPEEHGNRLGLLEVAGVYHREEVLGWLCRDATVFEREVFAMFALERHLADALVVAVESGLRPWWSRTRELALNWPPAAELEFGDAPAGFSAEGGWWTRLSGKVRALPFQDGPWRLPSSVTRELVVSAVLPPGVTILGKGALRSCWSLEQLLIPGVVPGSVGRSCFVSSGATDVSFGRG